MKSKSKRDTNITVGDHHDLMELKYAVYRGQYEVVECLIEKASVKRNINRRYYIGKETVLHVAATYGKYEIVKLLIEEGGANLDIVDNEGYTALHYAAERGRYEIVKLLLEKGANLNIKNDDDQTPLELAETLSNQSRSLQIQLLLKTTIQRR